VVAAFLNRLKPSITFVLDLVFRWSCSIRLFRNFADQTFVSPGSRPSTFISRTARCEAAHEELGLHLRLFYFGRVNAQIAQVKGQDAEMLTAYRLAA